MERRLARSAGARSAGARSIGALAVLGLMACLGPARAAQPIDWILCADERNVAVATAACRRILDSAAVPPVEKSLIGVIEHEGAKAALKEAGHPGPEFLLAETSVGYCARGTVRVLGGENEKGIADLKRSIALDPRNVLAWIILAMEHNYKEREIAALAALNLEPENILAVAALAESVRGEAGRARLRALLAERSDLLARSAVGSELAAYIATQLDDNASAVEWRKRAVALPASGNFAHLNRSRALMDLGKELTGGQAAHAVARSIIIASVRSARPCTPDFLGKAIALREGARRFIMEIDRAPAAAIASEVAAAP